MLIIATFKSFLPVIILLYELMPGRRARREPRVGPDHDDMNDSNFDYVKDVARESKPVIAIGTLLFTYGTYVASSNNLRSTYFCSSLLDEPSSIVSIQWVSLVLDGITAILFWRILAWARTTKGRLRTLSGILLSCALGTGLLYSALGQFYHYRPVSYQFKGLDSLYVFDILIDGFMFSVFFISSGLVISETTPLTLTGTITCAVGILAAWRRLWFLGSWENVAPGSTLGAMFLICVGFSIFLYANSLATVALVRRGVLASFLLFLLLFTTIFTAFNGRGIVMFHPLSQLIYDTRVSADRWLVHAKVSSTLKVAVQEYQERHNGRDPPPNYNLWYDFAVARESPILDHFPQIEHELSPFWGMPPAKIRESIARASSEPDMAVVQIRGGTASHNLPSTSPNATILDHFVGLISNFAEHLSDMELPVNLNEQPRVLAPWDDVHRFREAGKRRGLKKLLSRRSGDGEVPGETEPSLEPRRDATHGATDDQNFTSVKVFREMTALSCPQGTTARSGVHWDIRDFCSSCASPQAHGQYVKDWDIALDLCHQPDLYRLHSFYMTPPDVRPIQELLPVFGRSKTTSYSDILIPLARADQSEVGETGGSSMKWKKLYWRGRALPTEWTHELWRGGQQQRLVHLLNNGTDTTPILMATADEDMFRHQVVSTARLNQLLPLDVAFSDQSTCHADDPGCSALQAEFGLEPEDFSLGNMYVLLVDGDKGPSTDILHVLRSGSVPMIASIFKEWYTERLVPWTHFVPIDIRFHALHSTLAYFTGLHGELNGRDPEMPDTAVDAQWIAEQGRRWAGRATRPADQEVYLFRLLLEWGRIIDDERDGMGLVLKEA